MQLTIKQEEGLKLVVQKYRNKDKYAIISGYAGTGKSTLIKFIIDAIGINPDFVAFATFTGKAAQVLADKGNKNAMTLHHLLYKTIRLPDGKFVFKKNKAIPYKIVVVDECSMAPKELVNDLLNHNAFIIFCGDPFQIPPINPDSDNHLLDKPDIFLDQIMRQAADSGIIQLSMKIRNGESIKNFSTNDVKVLPKSQFVDGMIEWADIAICSTNNMRKNINETARKLLGYTEPFVNGEKVICCRNYWDVISEKENGLTNGCIGYINNFKYGSQYVPPFLKVPNNKIPIIQGDFRTEFDDNYYSLSIDKTFFMTEQNFLTARQQYAMNKNLKTKGLIPYEFTYAYAITGHKAQGSQWNKVLVVEEGFPFEKEDHARWLYTVCTRASEKLVLITKE